MGKARDAYGLVFRALQERIRQGRYDPGALIAIGDLATEFRTSTTPVREALARLSGLELVEEARGRGYAYLAFDAARLRRLYELQHGLLTLALGYLDEMRGRETVAAFAQEGTTDNAAQLAASALRGIAAASGNPPLAQMHETVLGRLGAARRAEIRVLPPFEGRATLAALQAADTVTLRNWIETYFTDRLNNLFALERAIGMNSTNAVEQDIW